MGLTLKEYLISNKSEEFIVTSMFFLSAIKIKISFRVRIQRSFFTFMAAGKIGFYSC